MRERPTARVLLFDPAGRILLMHGVLPSDPGGPSFWFTVGGGLEPGESLHEAAAREIREETGFADAELGPVVWYSEGLLTLHDDQPALFKEHYIIARTTGGDPSRGGWDDLEQRYVDGQRWWTLGEIRASDETIYPEGLGELLEDVLAGRFASEPLVIRTLDGVVRPLPRVI